MVAAVRLVHWFSIGTTPTPWSSTSASKSESAHAPFDVSGQAAPTSSPTSSCLGCAPAGAVAVIANNFIDGFNNPYYGAFTCE